MRSLFEGGVYLRVEYISLWVYVGCSIYSKAAFIQGRRLFEGGV